MSGLWLLLTIGTALAGRVTLDEIEGWLPDLRTEIEGESGLRFVAVPTLEITTPLEIPSLMEARGVPEFTEIERASVVDLAQRALALYEPASQQIYVNKLAIEDRFGRMTEDRGSLPPTLRCIVMHELVHALVDQRIRMPTQADISVAAALNEGAATLLSERVCPVPDAVRLINTLLGLDRLSSEDPRRIGPHSYGIAERFLRRVHAARGWPAVWAAVANPPPNAVISAAVEASVSAPWRDDAPIRGAVAGFLEPTARLDTRVTSASAWLGDLDASAIEPKWLFGGDGGLVVSGHAGAVTTVLGVVHTADTKRVRAWLHNRARRFGGGGAMLPVGGFKYSWTASLPAWGLLGHGFTANARIVATIVPHPWAASYGREVGCQEGHRAECAYTETWGLTGSVLAGLVVKGADPEPATLDGVIRTVTAHYPSERALPADWGTLEWPEPPPAPTQLNPVWMLQWMELRLAKHAPCAGGPRTWLAQVSTADVASLEPTLSRCTNAP